MAPRQRFATVTPENTVIMEVGTSDAIVAEILSANEFPAERCNLNRNKHDRLILEFKGEMPEKILVPDHLYVWVKF